MDADQQCSNGVPSAVRLLEPLRHLHQSRNSVLRAGPNPAGTGVSAQPLGVATQEISGSSDIRWGSWGESAGGEEHAEPVVVAVAEAAGEAAVQLDDPVHGLSAAVR